MSDQNVFGEWRTAADGRTHYYLAGKPLCGRSVKATGPPPDVLFTNPGNGKRYPQGPDTSRDCPACKRRNFARWSATEATPTPPTELTREA